MIPMIKKVFGNIIVIFLILLTVSGCYGTDKTMTIKIKDIRKHGNLILAVTVAFCLLAAAVRESPARA